MLRVLVKKIALVRYFFFLARFFSRISRASFLSTVVGSIFFGMEAFSLPFVTYGPNLPFLTRRGSLELGSSPSSAIGFAASFFCLSASLMSLMASGSFTVNTVSSSGMEALILPALMYGPYGPSCAVITVPSGILPTSLGSSKRGRTSSRVHVSKCMPSRRETDFGLLIFSLRSSSLQWPSCAYGPKRPTRTTIGSFVMGSLPSSRSFKTSSLEMSFVFFSRFLWKGL